MVTYSLISSSFCVMLVGLFGMLVHKNIIRILLAVNILETGVNLLIVALGYFPGGAAPIITQAISAANLPFVDPLPQALVLTSIVIGLGTTALALTITLRYYRERRTLDLGSETRVVDALDAESAGRPAETLPNDVRPRVGATHGERS